MIVRYNKFYSLCFTLKEEKIEKKNSKVRNHVLLKIYRKHSFFFCVNITINNKHSLT